MWLCAGVSCAAVTQRPAAGTNAGDAAVRATVPHVTCHVAADCPVATTSALPHATAALAYPAPCPRPWLAPVARPSTACLVDLKAKQPLLSAGICAPYPPHAATLP